MYSFFQSLLRNCILGVVFSLIMILFAIFITSKYSEERQNTHANIITDNFHSIIKNKPEVELSESIYKELVDCLRLNQKYTLLKVDLNNTNNIYNYYLPISSFTLPYTAPKTQQVKLGNNLTVSYQLNIENESNLIIKILFLILGLTFIFILISTILSSHNYNRLLTTLCNKFKVAIKKGYDNHKDINTDTNPELNDVYIELKKLIDFHHENRSDLENKAYLEPITKLSNRSRFVQYFENNVNKDNSIQFGALTITRCSELQTINQIHGYNAGDNYICGVADIMKATITRYQGAQLFRLNSSDFATIIPNCTMKTAESYTEQLTDKFNLFQQASDLDSVAYTGLVAFSKDMLLGELLALADTSINIAQTKNKNSWHTQTDSDISENSNVSHGNQSWRQEIDRVIETQNITLLVQNIKPSNRNVKVYGEILARFLNSKDEILPTSSFIAMAEKLDKIVAIDKMIIEKVLFEILNKSLTDYSYGINVSTRSINDEYFLIWLERRLLRDQSIAAKLVFEITEYGLQQNIKSSKRFIDMIHRAGSKVTVERFGVGLTSFKFFKGLKPDFIKMDSTYTRGINEDKNNQYFLRLMVDLAHRLNITVLAESIESQEEKVALEKLFIDGCQGFHIGKPLPL